MSHADIPEVLYEWASYRFQILSHSTRSWFARQLDPQRDSFSPINRRLQDWRGVAEMLGYEALDIDNFERHQHPTLDLFRQWAIMPEATIGALLESIKDIERFDILCDQQMVEILDRDVTDYRKKEEAKDKCENPVQVQEVESSDDQPVDEFKNITVNEALTGIPEIFDAFVCYTRQDFDFVKDMIHRLETVHGLKLCIPDRDLMPGCAKYVILAKLIQERCRKMIIVLSPNYTESDECRFQTLFAHSLAPGAQQKKLIPILYQQCAIPSILNYICLVDYTRCDVVDWFWQRLANSLKADRRANLLNPLAMAAASTQNRRDIPARNGEFTRNDSRTSLTSTQAFPSSSAVSAPLLDKLSIEQRSYSNPSLASSGDGFTVTSNLVYPEEWRMDTRDDASIQSSDDCPNTYEMEEVQIGASSFIDIRSESKTKTETPAEPRKKPTTFSLFGKRFAR